MTAVRVLAVRTADRYKLRPELPTLAEGGVTGYSAAAWSVLPAPAKTPAEIVANINSAFREALKSPDVGRADSQCWQKSVWKQLGGSREDPER
jgi:tripartite-type tricarboxylate transporter receptor subunit TctC